MANYTERPYCRKKIYELMVKHNCDTAAELYNSSSVFLFGKYERQCKKMILEEK